MVRSPSAVFLVALVATSEAAAEVSYHAIGSGDIGFTDNVFSEQRGNQDGDLFFQIRPGLLFNYGTPRFIQELNAEAEITQYALHSQEASLAGRGGWTGLIIPGPRSNVTFAVNAGSGRLSAITARTPPDQVIAELQPLGNISFRSADASEFATYLASRQFRLSQRLFARANKSDDNASDVDPMTTNTVVTSAEAGGTVGLSRMFRMSSLSIDVGASVFRLERVAPADAIQPSRLDQQVNPRVRGTYQRDLDRRLSGSIDGGLVYVIPYGTDPYNPGVTRSRGLFPVAGAQAAYTDAWGVATLTFRRDVTPNLFLAQNTVTDAALVAAALPVPWREDNRRRQPKLIALGSVAVIRTQLVDPVTTELQSSFGLARVDLGLQYSVRPGFSYTIRYELMLQTGDPSAEMPRTGFFRNTFFFSFKYRYPEEIAVPVPRRRGQGVRSDRQDQMPLGSEPVIPDLLDEEQ